MEPTPDIGPLCLLNPCNPLLGATSNPQTGLVDTTQSAPERPIEVYDDVM